MLLFVCLPFFLSPRTSPRVREHHQALDAAHFCGYRKNTKFVQSHWSQSGGESCGECSCERECSFLCGLRNSQILVLHWWLLRSSSTQSFIWYFHFLSSKVVYAKPKDKMLVVPEATKCNAKKRFPWPCHNGKLSGCGIGTQMCMAKIHYSTVQI